LEIDFGRFNYSFTQVQPASGVFTTLTINDGPAFGLAEHIDPRNLDRSDTATIDVNSGAVTSAEFITLTANVAAHELGHLLGLRHFDSFGPIGSGLDPNTAAPNSFGPNFNGPSGADETQFHILESDSLLTEDTVDQFFSERSAIKLAFIEQGTVIQESGAVKDTIDTAQSINLDQIIVPNTLQSGDRAGLGDFDVDAITVTGSLGTDGFDDFYEFSALAGDLINIELYSNSIRTNLSAFDTTLRVLGPGGAEINYFGANAFNDDELETFDSILIDLVLPEDGQYFVQVGSFSGSESGTYELFVNRFNGVAVPEPTSFAVLLLAGMTGLARRRRS